MYLKSLKIENYRKFSGENDNEVFFVEGYGPCASKSGIAKNTTLLVGRNNSGKTSVIRLLEKLGSISSSSPTSIFQGSDFSFEYLQDWLSKYIVKRHDGPIELPFIRVTLTIKFDSGKNDYLQNLGPFLTIGSEDVQEFKIIFKYTVKDEQDFRSRLNASIDSKEKPSSFNVYDFIEFLNAIIDSNGYEIQFYTESGKKIGGFKLSNLITVDSLSAIIIQKEGKVLAEQLSRILELRYKKDRLSGKNDLEEHINEFNKALSQSFGSQESKTYNNLLRELFTSDITVSIAGNLGLDDVFSRYSNILRYSYSEGESGKLVPEDQFGLGYSSLLMIIAKIMELVESECSEDGNSSKINMICIEEPENHLHPQMQEMFIRHISDAVGQLVSTRKLNFQLVITTHSSHILNSKLRDSGRFDSINFLTSDVSGSARVIKLEDVDVRPSDSSSDNDFRFIQKHITLGMSDIFFADALIMVEGDSEMKLLPFLMQHYKLYENLRGHFITFVSIGGAHGYVYHNLLAKLGIPTAIITDLDIERDECTKIEAISDLSGRKTTNQTLIKFYNNNELDKIDSNGFRDGNIGVFTQGSECGYYPSSFEGALYLANIENDIVKEVISSFFPRASIGSSMGPDAVETWQNRLSNKKGDFSSELLYKLMTDEKALGEFKVPEYIDMAFRYIEEKVSGGSKEGTIDEKNNT